MLAEPGKRVLDCLELGGVALGDFRRPAKRRLCPFLNRYLRDRLTIRRHDHPSDIARAPGRLDRVGKQRPATQRFDVLMGNTLRTASRNYQPQDLHAIDRSLSPASF